MSDKEYIESIKHDFNVEIKFYGNDCLRAESKRHHYENHGDKWWCNKCGREILLTELK